MTDAEKITLEILITKREMYIVANKIREHQQQCPAYYDESFAEIVNDLTALLNTQNRGET